LKVLRSRQRSRQRSDLKLEGQLSQLPGYSYVLVGDFGS
jgi:hypothetical protein